MDYRLLNGGRTSHPYLTGGEVASGPLEESHEARFFVGGLHFWGHADFYVSIPVYAWGGGEGLFRSGVETGARYYPWRVEDGKMRPYVGASFNASDFTQGDGVLLSRTIYPLHAGLTLYLSENLFDFGASFNPNRRFEYFVDKTNSGSVEAPSLWFTLSYRRTLETTVLAEKDFSSGKTSAKTRELQKVGKLNGVFVAAGPSSSFFTKRSSFNESNRPYLGNHQVSGIFPDIALGYYHHGVDAQIDVAYRRVTSELSAYGMKQEVQREAFTLELCKFLFDYHGFVPFIGPALSYERLEVRERESGSTSEQSSTEGLRGGITFGWDVRPDRLQWFLLRTNLRYFPALDVKMADGSNVSLDQLEFNFIQLVLYPGRIKNAIWRD